MDNHTYYYCKCYSFNDELILCEECCKWVDDVETTIERHLNALLVNNLALIQLRGMHGHCVLAERPLLLPPLLPPLPLPLPLLLLLLLPLPPTKEEEDRWGV